MPQPADTSLVWLVVSWLAAWRLTALVAYEAGPFDVFSRLRIGLVRIRLQGLATCFHCLGFWISAAVVLIVYKIELRSVLLILAVAGAVSISERLVGGEMPAGKGDRK